MKQETAVEWLVQELNLPEYGNNLRVKVAIQKAKEMEKEQIIDAYTHDRLMLKITAEEYYNEKFKSE